MAPLAQHPRLHAHARGAALVGVTLVIGLHADLPIYDEAQAIRFARFAQVSFCSKEAVTAWDCGPFCEHSPIQPGSARFLSGEKSLWGVQGYVAKLPASDAADGSARCVGAFRGTKDPDVDPASWKNSLTDAMFLQTPWPPSNFSWLCPVDWFCHKDEPWCKNCWVHTGFSSAWYALLPHFMRALEELQCTSLVLTGHSLGAGVAEVASAFLRGRGVIHVEPVWSFGKPRSGNAAFVRSVLEVATAQGVSPPTWRVVHYHDLVPRLPPVAMAYLGIDYTHGPLEVYYSESSSSYEICPSDADHLENDSCMLRIAAPDCTLEDHTLYLNLSFEGTTMPQQCLRSSDARLSLAADGHHTWRELGAELGAVLCGLVLVFACLHREAWTRKGIDSRSDARETVVAPLLHNDHGGTGHARLVCCTRRTAAGSDF